MDRSENIKLMQKAFEKYGSSHATITRLGKCKWRTSKMILDKALNGT